MSVDFGAVLTVFSFVMAFAVMASYGAFLFAQWENRKTKEKIDQTFEHLKQRLKGHL